MRLQTAPALGAVHRLQLPILLVPRVTIIFPANMGRKVPALHMPC